MSQWYESPEVQHAGCSCLGFACKFKSTKTTTGLVVSGALEAATKALEKYPSVLKVQKYGCLALSCIRDKKDFELYVANELKCVPLVANFSNIPRATS